MDRDILLPNPSPYFGAAESIHVLPRLLFLRIVLVLPANMMEKDSTHLFGSTPSLVGSAEPDPSLASESAKDKLRHRVAQKAYMSMVDALEQTDRTNKGRRLFDFRSFLSS